MATLDGDSIEVILAEEDLCTVKRYYSMDQGALCRFVEANLPRLAGLALKEVPEDAAEKDPNVATLYPSNATEILVKYVTATNHITIDDQKVVIPLVFAHLAKRGPMHHVIAINIKRILLAAFVEDCQGTTECITLSLNEEILHGAIRHLSTSSHVSSMLLGLMGTALPAEMAIVVPPATFVDQWIKLRFPYALATYVKVAMSDIRYLPYFQFMSELVHQATSLHVGPLVDELFAVGVIEVLILSVIEAVEETDGSIETFPLASSGVHLLTHVVENLVSSVGGTVTSTIEYNQSLDSLVPVFFLMLRGSRLVACLLKDAIVASGPSPKALGAVRFRIIELGMSLLRFGRIDTDRFLIRSGFIRTMFDVIEKFPDCDPILVFAREVAMEPFARLSRHADHNHSNIGSGLGIASADPSSPFTSHPPPPVPKTKYFGMGELFVLRHLCSACRLLPRVLKWCTDPAFRGTCVAAQGRAMAQVFELVREHQPFLFKTILIWSTLAESSQPQQENQESPSRENEGEARGAEGEGEGEEEEIPTYFAPDIEECELPDDAKALEKRWIQYAEREMPSIRKAWETEITGDDFVDFSDDEEDVQAKKRRLSSPVRHRPVVNPMRLEFEENCIASPIILGHKNSFPVAGETGTTATTTAPLGGESRSNRYASFFQDDDDIMDDDNGAAGDSSGASGSADTEGFAVPDSLFSDDVGEFDDVIGIAPEELDPENSAGGAATAAAGGELSNNEQPYRHPSSGATGGRIDGETSAADGNISRYDAASLLATDGGEGAEQDRAAAEAAAAEIALANEQACANADAADDVIMEADDLDDVWEERVIEDVSEGESVFTKAKPQQHQKINLMDDDDVDGDGGAAAHGNGQEVEAGLL